MELKNVYISVQINVFYDIQHRNIWYIKVFYNKLRFKRMFEIEMNFP